MTNLHMETDHVRNLGELLCRVSNAIHEEIYALSNSVNSLAVNWQGSSSDEFVAEAQGVIGGMTDAAEDGISLSLRVLHEVTEWEERDFMGANNFKGIIPISTKPGDPGVPEVPGDEGKPTGHEELPPAPPPNGVPENPTEPAPDTPGHSSPGNGHNEDDEDHQESGGDSHGQDGHSSQPGGSSGPGHSGGQPGSHTGGHSGTPSTPGAAAGVVAGTVAATTSGNQNGKEEDAAETRTPAGPAPLSYSREDSWGARFDQLQEVEKQIEELEDRPFNNLTPEQQQQLHDLRQERTVLTQAISEGIPEDGPGAIHDNFPEGECTWYASSRRNFGYDITGHAKVWNEKALAAGYEVGEVPVKGSIMVWQPGVHGASEEYGHVSFVERIEPAGNGAFRVWYTDNDHMDPRFPVNVLIMPGENGVDFIYGKINE